MNGRDEMTDSGAPGTGTSDTGTHSRVISSCETTPRETWREAVDHEIRELGWERQTRIEIASEEIAIYVVDAVSERDLTFHPEGPPTFSLSVVLDGRGTFSVDGATPIEVRPGLAMLFVSTSYSRGENTIPGRQRLRIVDLRFEASLLTKAGGPALAKLGADVLSEHSRPDVGVQLIGFPASPTLLDIANGVANCSLKEGLARRLFMHSKAIEALSDVVSVMQAPAAPTAPLKPEMRRKLELARELVDASFAENWTIARLAREVGLNERQLKDGFRKLIGNSVHAYLRDARLRAAAQMLIEGRSVTETALSVGFENLSHFSKVFRDAKGVTPRRWAEAHNMERVRPRRRGPYQPEA